MRNHAAVLALALISTLVVATPAFSDDRPLDEYTIPSFPGEFPSDPDKFTFAIIGDNTGGGAENWPTFDRAMEEIDRLNPDFAITVGDHIQGYVHDQRALKSMWAEYTEHISKLDVPVMLVPGNHDISNTIMYTYWQEHIGKTYYSFDYKGCHFLVLSTEESKSPQTAAVAEKAMMEFAVADIQEHKDARHIFIFMHRPIWVDARRWRPIETALQGAKATVIGGHWHRLMYERRDDITYIVIGATGAGLREFPLPKLGRFHHFAFVSVEGREAEVAVVRPGSILPQDISPRELHERVRASMVRTRPEMPIPTAEGRVAGRIVATIDNKADETIRATISMLDVDESLWEIAPGEVTLEAAPGQKTESVFDLVYGAKSIARQPRYAVESYYAGIKLGRWERHLRFADAAGMRGVDRWMTSGLSALPASEPRNAMVNVFKGARLDEAAVSWQVARADGRGRLDLDRIHDKPDNVLGFARAFIHSPESKTVWGALVADDLAALTVNGERILPTYDLDSWRGGVMFFPVELRADWNQVLVKSADFTGSWYFTFMLDDPDAQLSFAPRIPPDAE